MLDAAQCYRALKTKDARFDGQFFVAVRTTGIYCRPICPATTPKPENCTFFPSAAAAQTAGFRPCLRCRPELAPHLLAYIGTSSTVARALRLIADGFLDEQSVTDLATRLGISDRHLRQLFIQHLGTTPIAVAQTRRLHFAKQLIDETALSMTDIALSAGFSSLRRFNDVIVKTYGRSPSELRRSSSTVPEGTLAPTITLKLPFSPPYDWASMMRFLQARATPGLEVVTADSYQRSIELAGHYGSVEVRPVAGQFYLVAQIHFPKVTLLAQIVERLRHMFDLNANMSEITAHLQQDERLAPLVAMRPGLRIPGAWDAFELAVRAILGQQVSVAAATTLAGRLVSTYGTPLPLNEISPIKANLQLAFPPPPVLASADLTAIGMPKTKARAISALAALTVAQPASWLQAPSLEEAVRSLCQVPGIGEWTAHYIAMRALREPDAFPASDLALRRAMSTLGEPVTAHQLLEQAQPWRPWRAYAAMQLWALDSYPSLNQRSLSA